MVDENRVKCNPKLGFVLISPLVRVFLFSGRWVMVPYLQTRFRLAASCSWEDSVDSSPMKLVEYQEAR